MSLSYILNNLLYSQKRKKDNEKDPEVSHVSANMSDGDGNEDLSRGWRSEKSEGEGNQENGDESFHWEKGPPLHDSVLG